MKTIDELKFGHIIKKHPDDVCGRLDVKCEMMVSVKDLYTFIKSFEIATGMELLIHKSISLEVKPFYHQKNNGYMKIEVKLELKISNNADFPTVMEYLKFWYGCTDSYNLKNLAGFNPYKDMKTTKCTIKQKGTKDTYTFEEDKEEAKQQVFTLKDFGFSNE